MADVLLWVGCTLTLIGILLNTKKHIFCWPIWLLSNIAWIIGALSSTPYNYPVVVLNSIFFFANLNGWNIWEKEEAKRLEKLYGDPELDKVRTEVALVQVGIKTPNEIRKERGLPPLDEGDDKNGRCCV